MKSLIWFIAGLALLAPIAHAADLSDAEVASIGRRVWVNECDGTISGLTSWNEGEAFASLGIGHFIWYPAGRPGPFEESFPALVRYLTANGVSVPAWMHGTCPWDTRSDFMAAQSSDQMETLRHILASTIPLQARFLALRMHYSLAKMLSAAPGNAGVINKNFGRLQATGPGTFALIDYVNFKGEGTLATERYKGEGWGLLQVLESMPPNGNALRDFSRAAKDTLARRVFNSPPERHEERWLPGWDARVERYME
jgi:hypothetical protein